MHGPLLTVVVDKTCSNCMVLHRKTVMFVSFIIRIFQLIFLARIVFFSHNKSAKTVFRLVFQRSERGYVGLPVTQISLDHAMQAVVYL